MRTRDRTGELRAKQEARLRFADPPKPGDKDRRGRWKFGAAAQLVADRFWSKVDKNGPVPGVHPELGPCWLWTGALSLSGYGQWHPFAGIHVPAHRFALILKLGRDLERDEVSRHLCHVRRCVNPDHLTDGSQSDNMLDSVRDGTAYVGSLNAVAAFTDEQVIDLRLRAAVEYFDGWFTREAERLGVHNQMIGLAVRGETYANLPHAINVGRPTRGLIVLGADHCFRGHPRDPNADRCRPCAAIRQRGYRLKRPSSNPVGMELT